MTPAAALAELVAARQRFNAADEAGDVAAESLIDQRIAALEVEIETQVATTPADLLAQAEHLVWMAEVLPGALSPDFARTLQVGVGALLAGSRRPPGV